MRAAEAAVSAVAYDDAARFLEAALTIAVDGRAELLLRAADATMRAGDVTRAKARCLEAHDLARRTGDRARQIAAAAAYGDAAWHDARDGATAARLLRGVLGLAEDEVTGSACRRRSPVRWRWPGTVRGPGSSARTRWRRRARSTTPRRCAWRSMRCRSPRGRRRPWRANWRSSASRRRGAVRGDVEWENLATSKMLYGEITAGDLDGARATSRRHRELADADRPTAVPRPRSPVAGAAGDGRGAVRRRRGAGR